MAVTPKSVDFLEIRQIYAGVREFHEMQLKGYFFRV